MRTEDFDKNLKIETSIPEGDIVWFSPKEAPFSIHGLYAPKEAGAYQRMPARVAAAVSPGVAWLATNTAGGRVRFTTDSPYIAIKAVMPSCGTMPHITKMGQSGFDMYRYIAEGTAVYRGSFFPPGGVTEGYESILYVDGTLATYSVNMPLYDGVWELYIGLKAGSELKPAVPYTYQKPVLYYGSSITQGGCASRPGNAYEAMIERMLDTDYINLGFSGSALGEPRMAEYLASIDASVFVCDYDHNAPTPAHLAATHYPLYRTYREAHPDTPIIFVTKPDFHPGMDEARRVVVYETYVRAKAEGDENVYFIDGETLFDGEMRDSCTVDGCHPNDLGFLRMAQKIGRLIGKLLPNS